MIAEIDRLLRRSHPHPRAPSRSFVESRLENRRRRVESGRKLADLPLQEWIDTEWLPVGGAANNFSLILDTTAPAGVTLSINGGATYVNNQIVSAAIGTSDTPTTGYQMLIWGDVDNTYNASIQTTQGASSWITYSTTQSVKLGTGDGAKNLHVQVRDDVWNASATVDAATTLDTTVPVVSIQSGPTASKVSTVSGKDTCSVTWQSDSQYQAYEVEVVANGTSLRGSGTVIGSANGSTNVSGGGGPATTNVTSTIHGADLQTASSGDGTKVVKIFVQDMAGNWST